jgi:DNA polymerase-1
VTSIREDAGVVLPADDPDAMVAALAAAGVERNTPVAIALAAGPDGQGVVGLATTGPDGATPVTLVGARGAVPALVDVVDAVEQALRPRWVWWQREPVEVLVRHGVRLAACWDLSAVHRIVRGGWRSGEVQVWCDARGLDHRAAPVAGQLDLGTGDAGDGPHPAVRADGHLRAEWVDGSWRADPAAAARWAELALDVHVVQRERLAALGAAGDPMALARSESAAEMLCAELEHDGLPIDVDVARALLTQIAGPRPADEREAAERRVERDAIVLAHLPAGGAVDLRNPADVKAMLRRVGIDVPDTRAWRLEAMREVHPVVDALLQWRKAERIATTFGHQWLDEHVHDGRLRGAWSSTDGAAGRMTAQAGLHNLPAELRPVVRADPGWVFVQADLGQIEPRVLAAVSGDRALVQATRADDLYRPVADRLRVERPIAKVAVLAAMYGQTSGTAGQALQGMERAYPVAMQYLRDADRAGREGRELRTFGGRLIPMYDTIAERDDEPDDGAVDDRSVSAALAARGRYARNASVQGAAAEVFKAWAATVRARLAGTGARVVLCLHDELILHVPESEAEHAATTVRACLDEATGRWFRGSDVRFVTDVQIVRSWADAKG